MNLNLVTTLEQIVQNLEQFNDELNNKKMTINTKVVQQWYYIMDLDIFAPGRYIGYQDMDINTYNGAHPLNGRKTSATLGNWFETCNDVDLYEKISNKLIDYLSHHNMDVRRNSNKQPAFKLHLLYEDLPKLKQLYLYEVPANDKWKCQTCNKSFWEEPLYAHNNRGPYCEIECLPDGTLDEYCAMDYAHFIASYRESVILFDEIENLEMRNNLLTDLHDFIDQMGEYILGDPESAYEEFIVALLPKFEALLDDTWNFYVDEEHLEIEPAIHISWEYLLGKGIPLDKLNSFVNHLEKLLKRVNPYFEIMYTQYFYIANDSRSIIYYPSDSASLDTMIVLDEVYNECINLLKDYPSDDDLDIYIFKMYVARCPKCTLYEPLEDFSLDKENNASYCQTGC